MRQREKCAVAKAKSSTGPYRTHTGLTLRYERLEDGKTDRVTIEGDRVKVLYEGDSFGAAMRVYQGVKEHYEERRRVERSPPLSTSQEG